MAKEIQLLINNSDLDKRFYKLDGIEVNKQLDSSYQIGQTKTIPINWNNDDPLNIAIKTTPAVAAPKIIDNQESVVSYNGGNLTSVKHSSGLFALTTNGKLCAADENYSISITGISFPESGNYLLRDLGVLSMDYIKLSTNDLKLSTYLSKIGPDTKEGFNILNTSVDKESVFQIYLSTSINASGDTILYDKNYNYWVNVSSSTIQGTDLSYNYTVGTISEDFGKNKFTVHNKLYKVPFLGISNKSTIKGGVSKNAPNIYISSGILNCDPETSKTFPKAIIPFQYYNESLPEGKEGFLVGYNMIGKYQGIQFGFFINSNNQTYSDFIPYFYTLDESLSTYTENYYQGNTFVSSNSYQLREFKSADSINDYSEFSLADGDPSNVTYDNSYNTLVEYHLQFKPKEKTLALKVNLTHYNQEVADPDDIITLVDVDDNRTAINISTSTSTIPTIYISSKAIAREY